MKAKGKGQRAKGKGQRATGKGKENIFLRQRIIFFKLAPLLSGTPKRRFLTHVEVKTLVLVGLWRPELQKGSSFCGCARRVRRVRLFGVLAPNAGGFDFFARERAGDEGFEFLEPRTGPKISDLSGARKASFPYTRGNQKTLVLVNLRTAVLWRPQLQKAQLPKIAAST